MKQIEDLDEFKKELKSAGDKLVVVDFFATWCGPCKQLTPKMDKFIHDFPNVVFMKVDVDEAEDIVEEYKNPPVNALPTIKLFKRGKQVNALTGIYFTNMS